jgi:putative transposase
MHGKGINHKKGTKSLFIPKYLFIHLYQISKKGTKSLFKVVDICYTRNMSKIPRVDIANHVYHVWNRSNGGLKIFEKRKDYRAFEEIIAEAKEKVPIKIFAYCVMPNHWHFVLQTQEDGDLSRFIHWLTVTHATRLHVVRGTEGGGHIYQGTYKSNICQNDNHLLQLIRYVERNALRAGLVEKAEEWEWSSGWRRLFGTRLQQKMLDEWPIETPNNYHEMLNAPQNEDELENVRVSIKRGSPYGAGQWKDEMIDKYDLESTVRQRGRPKKGT